MKVTESVVEKDISLKWFVNPKIHCADAGLVCVAHIFTHFKTLVAGFGLCVVQLKRQ